MDIILGIIILLFLGYSVLLLFYMWSWGQISSISAKKNEPCTGVSVLVPVRNEAERITKCIDSILDQDYTGSFDIIIIDDHSTDGTLELVRDRYGAVMNVRLKVLSELKPVMSGKKAALAYGMTDTTGEIIVTTDGDCIYSSAWLTTLVNTFSDNTQIVTGPVVYPEATKLFTGFQVLDLLSLILATAAGIQSRLYFLGNGANLAFRKSAFSAVDGYRGNEEYVSGDDLFLIQKVVNHYGVNSIAYAKSNDAMVLTDPPKTLHTFLSQRLRWASKNNALTDRRINYIWIFLWCVNAAVLLLLIFGIFGYVPLLLVAVLLYIKMLIEGIALYQISGYFNMRSSMRWFPWAFFLNIFYVVVIGITATILPSFEWKDRKA